MTKQEYLMYRNKTSIELMYAYYKEHFDSNVHKPFLNINDFHQFINLWPGARAGYDKVIRYYDEKFNVSKLLDKDGNLIGLV